MNIRISKKLAYDVGVHIGDGNMYSKSRTHRVTYSGDLSNEEEFYLLTLKPLLASLYKKEPRNYKRQSDNTILLVINSKELVEFKNKVLNLPIGKKNEVKIPDLILKDKKLLLSCLRGIGDTDFSLSFKKNRKGIHTEPRMELYSQSKFLIEQIKNALIDLGFTLSVEKKIKGSYKGYMIRIYGKRNLSLWLKLIGFSNPYRTIKIKVWQKLGYFIPRKKYRDYVALLNQIT